MVTLFDQDKVWEIHEYNVRREAHEEGRMEGLEKGLEKGRMEGREEGIRSAVSILKGFSIDKNAVIQTIAEKFDLLPKVAEEKVERYWKQ